MVEWSDLPKELCLVIGELLHTRIHLLRFRSVCSSWRSSIPSPIRPPQPPFPLKFSDDEYPKDLALFFQSTIYLIKSSVDEDHSGNSKPWLVKLEEDPSSGLLLLLHPVTNSPLRSSLDKATSLPLRYALKELNLLEYQLVELRKSYGLKLCKDYGNVTISSVHKLVVLPHDHLDVGDVHAVFMLYNEGKLGFMRFGDEELTHVDEENSHYDDIIVYNGECYVVDKWGTVSWLTSALEVIQLSHPLCCGFGGRKHLVESCGDLYVVDQYYERVSVRHGREDDNIFGNYHNSRYDSDALDFKVYKLDQECGRWDSVKNLGDDQVFVLSKDESFSVCVRGFDGAKGNCIFFVERVSPTVKAKYHSRVFDLEDGSMRDLASLPSALMFQLPSAWLSIDTTHTSSSECFECEYEI